MERPHKQHKKQNLKKHWVNIHSKNALNKDSLTKKLYNSYIHCYLITPPWHKTNLHKTPLKQKLAIHVICSESKLMNTMSLMQSLQVLNNKHSKITVLNLW